MDLLLADVHHRDLNAPINAFQDCGFARLGPVLSPEFAAALAHRANELMLDNTLCPGLFYQHDSPTGRYEDVKFGAGWVGPSKRYRKLERLERDPLFRSMIENSLFRRIAQRMLGEEVYLYRAVLWNKAPRVGMAVPWHQDDGKFWGLSQPPFLQVWTGLDDAPLEAGCLEVVPNSHLGGLASAEGGTLAQARLDQAKAEHHACALPSKRGESVLVHNHTWHRTGRNSTDAPRRAVSISFLGKDVRCKRRRRAPRSFMRLFEDSI